MKKSDKSTTRGAADLQAQLSESWTQQFGRSGETYGRFFSAMRDELTGFVQRRVDTNMSAWRAWSECRSFTDALTIQQNWLQSTVEQYVDQGNRVIETCRLAAADATEAVQAEAEKATAERKQTQRHAVLEIDEAA